jgi:predicted nicotinamide N-methyase
MTPKAADKKWKIFEFSIEKKEQKIDFDDFEMEKNQNVTNSNSSFPLKRRKRERKAADKYEKVQVHILEWIHQLDTKQTEEKEEEDTDKQFFGLFVWPSALVLTQFIASHHEKFAGKTILEIGCGTALPGLFCALHANVKKVSSVFFDISFLFESMSVFVVSSEKI